MPSERVIWGPPGTGKTVSGITLARHWMSQGTSSNQIAYLAFTKAAAKAAAMKIFQTEDDTRMAEEFPYFRTIHSLCYRGLLENGFQGLRKQPLITTGDMKQFQAVYSMPGAYSVYDWEDLAEVYAKMEDRGRSEWDQALSAYTFSRIKSRTIDELDRARVQPTTEGAMMLGLESMSLDVYQTFVEKYERFKKAEGIIDFTDMLEFGVRTMKPFDDIRYFVVDEAQDLSPIHHAILDRVASFSDEIWWIGDDDQCQPADTRVWISKNGDSKKISELEVGDTVVSFDRPGASLVAGKRVLETSSRKYTGNLYKIRIGDRVTRATSNHRFIARWIKDGNEKTCVTYLMERGGRWRVGWCQLYNAEKALHLGVRVNCEKAERAWILRVHRSRTEASIHESVVACRYGIPTVTFEPVNGAAHLTKEAIDEIFLGIGDRREAALRCLEDHGRDWRWPIIDRVVYPGRHRSTLVETQACNLMPSLMLLPIPSTRDRMKVQWESFTVSVSMVKDLPVHSLDIEHYHTYVADGIVTHNSIFSFSGASAELFLDRARRATYQIQLRQTHRFGQGIVDFADRIIKRVSNRHPKDIIGIEGREGRVEISGAFEPTPWDPQDEKGGDVIIVHRHVAGCQNAAQAYVDAGLPFRNERGRDPLDATKRLKAWAAVRNLSLGKTVSMTAVENVLDELLPSVALGDHNEKIRLVVHGSKSRVSDLIRGQVSLRDLISAKILTSEGAEVIASREYHTMRHSNDLDYYERVTKNGFDIEDDEAMRKIPRITTIHGAKGREAERAIVFSEMGDKCWGDPDNEHRLAYVAATRTKSDLTICVENTVHWARSAYDYPIQVPEEEPQGEPHA